MTTIVLSAIVLLFSVSAWAVPVTYQYSGTPFTAFNSIYPWFHNFTEADSVSATVVLDITPGVAAIDIAPLYWELSTTTSGDFGWLPFSGTIRSTDVGWDHGDQIWNLYSSVAEFTVDSAGHITYWWLDAILENDDWLRYLELHTISDAVIGAADWAGYDDAALWDSGLSAGKGKWVIVNEPAPVDEPPSLPMLISGITLLLFFRNCRNRSPRFENSDRAQSCR